MRVAKFSIIRTRCTRLTSRINLASRLTVACDSNRFTPTVNRSPDNGATCLRTVPYTSPRGSKEASGSKPRPSLRPPAFIPFTSWVALDETRIYRVVEAVDGLVRNVGPIVTGSIIHKDELLATFYNRDFLTAQQTYLFALDTMDRVKD